MNNQWLTIPPGGVAVLINRKELSLSASCMVMPWSENASSFHGLKYRVGSSLRFFTHFREGRLDFSLSRQPNAICLIILILLLMPSSKLVGCGQRQWTRTPPIRYRNLRAKVFSGSIRPRMAVETLMTDGSGFGEQAKRKR